MNAVNHNNVVIFDDRGIPSIMCRTNSCLFRVSHIRSLKVLNGGIE